MKNTILALAVFLLSGVAHASNSLARDIASLNVHLADTLTANETYTGVLADVQPVLVRAGPVGGIVGGLTFGTFNALLGTRIAERSCKAYQYIIRVDDPHRSSRAQVITVIQVDERPIQPGTPVFIVTHNAYGFAVRVIEAKTPDAYRVRGMEEKRQREGQIDERSFERDEAAKDAEWDRTQRRRDAR